MTNLHSFSAKNSRKVKDNSKNSLLSLNFIIYTIIVVSVTATSSIFIIIHFWDIVQYLHCVIYKCYIPSGECVSVVDSEKFDCYPEDGATEENCLNRGCCWRPKYAFPPLNEPFCFYPKNYKSYQFSNITSTENGITAFLERKFPSPYPNDSKILKMLVSYESSSVLHVKITDAAKSRFESPYPKIKYSSKAESINLNYKVEVSENKTGFAIYRLNGGIIFDSQDVGGLVYADQFLQISAKFNGSIFGLGEHQTRLLLDTNWQRFTLFNADAVPTENRNLYGSHPFYMVVEPSGTSHGVFFLNSNAMDILLQPAPAITFRTTGGILDFYFFLGPSPSDVVSQFTELVGRPFMPPYWSLGFHLCRFGYKNVSHIEAVLNRTIEAGIPLETQWMDIDYMIKRNDFTFDNVTFKELPAFIERIHKAGMHFVPILDPGISGSEKRGTYPPYDEGIKSDIFIKNENGSVFVGKVWNSKTTVFPDFTNPNTSDYWTKLIQKLHEELSIDGLWIDMNEPSNFLDGGFDGCPNNNLENPPYVPGVGGGRLSHNTICMSAKHYLGYHYNLHNLHGIAEADLTNRALSSVLKKRPFIISRATFSGIGSYAGHWSGDVTSTWEDFKMTIPQMLSFSLYGVPMMGADICGFNGNVTKDLCLRWSQLGAFYPFSRNHNTDDGIDQDPAAFGKEVADAARNALLVRYTLLPYLYTLFWESHVYGKTVARPLFFEFPSDLHTHSVDESFLLGCCIHVVPVLREFSILVGAYLPHGRWYNWYTFDAIDSEGTEITFTASSDTILVLIRGGSIIPTQEPALTTTQSRLNKMTLLAAYNTTLTAHGSLYWDEGDGLDTFELKTYGLVEFDLNAKNMTSKVVQWGLKESPSIEVIKILGFFANLKDVLIDGESVLFNWSSTSLVLTIHHLDIPVNKPFVVTWTPA